MFYHESWTLRIVTDVDKNGHSMFRNRLVRGIMSQVWWGEADFFKLILLSSTMFSAPLREANLKRHRQ